MRKDRFLCDLKDISVTKKSHFTLKTDPSSIHLSFEKVVSLFEGYFIK